MCVDGVNSFSCVSGFTAVWRHKVNTLSFQQLVGVIIETHACFGGMSVLSLENYCSSIHVIHTTHQSERSDGATAAIAGGVVGGLVDIVLIEVIVIVTVIIVKNKQVGRR